MFPDNTNMHQNISIFLDDPQTKGEKSKVFIQFYSSKDIPDVASARDYIKTKSPIPLLLRKRKKDEGLCVEVETVIPPKLVFGFSLPSGDPEKDLSEIIAWFEHEQNAIQIKLVD